MSRTALLFLAVSLVVVLAAGIPAQAQDAGSLLVPGDDGAVAITCSVTGGDLALTVTFPSPVKNYLTPARPVISMMMYFDTDKNVRTGYVQAEDTRRGGDYSVDVTVRRAPDSEATTDDITVAQYRSESSIATLVQAKTTLQIGGNRMQIVMPLSAMRLRKGQNIRVAAQNGASEFVEQSLVVK